MLENMNITIDDIEPLANGCTEVLVWHTQTKKVDVPIYKSWTKQGQNLDSLIVSMSGKGMLKESSSSEKEDCADAESCSGSSAVHAAAPTGQPGLVWAARIDLLPCV